LSPFSHQLRQPGQRGMPTTAPRTTPGPALSGGRPNRSLDLARERDYIAGLADGVGLLDDAAAAELRYRDSLGSGDPATEMTRGW
ncbi:MAG: hypothetical protein ACREOS_06300, partial [Candidatus Dormibacteraceae bacterium]